MPKEKVMTKNDIINATEPAMAEDKKLALADKAAKPPFKTISNGIAILIEKEDKSYYEWFCSHLEIVADTRDSNNRSWGRLLMVIDRDGKKHEWAMPMEMLASEGREYRRVLLSMGLEIAPGAFGAKALHQYISTTKPKLKARCVDKVGWHKACYVMPETTYGDTEGERVLLQLPGSLPAYEHIGTLEDWNKHIGQYCIGNSRLMLAVCIALASPLLYLVSEESTGIHFTGQSSSGKTTALHIAASVYGSRVKSWRTTDNAAENLALGSNDNLLCLDELSQVDDKVVYNVVYMLGNGQQKSRMNSNTTLQTERYWRLLFISSGEMGLSEKLKEGNKKWKAGQGVRFIEISADAGGGYMMFEDVHSFGDGNIFSQHLRHASENYRGTLGASFLEKITQDPEAIKASLQEKIKIWEHEQIDDNDDGQVKRVGRKFALISAAGELAIELGLVPWATNDVTEAIVKCFNNWIVRRGGDDASEIIEGMKQVASFFELHIVRFAYISDEPATIQYVNNQLGFKIHDDGGSTEYYATTSGFEEMCRGYDKSTIARALIDRGYMTGSKNKTSVSKQLKGQKKQRFYYFSADNIHKLREFIAKL